MFNETEWSKFYSNLKYPAAIDANATIYEALCKSVSKHPDRTALIFASRKYSYSQLKHEIDKAACYLYSLGIRKGDKIMLCAGGLPSVGIMVYAANVIGAVPSLFCGDYKPNHFKRYALADDYKLLIASGKQMQFYASTLGEMNIDKVIVATPQDFIGNIGTFISHVKGYIKKFYYAPDYSKVPKNITINSWRKLDKFAVDEELIKKLHSEVTPEDACLTVLENNTLKKRMFTSFDSKAINTHANLTGFLFKDTKDEENVRKYLNFFDLMYSVGFILGYNSVLLHGHTLCLKSWGEYIDNVKQVSYYEPNVILGFPTVLNEFADRERILGKRLDFVEQIICFGFPLSGAKSNQFVSFFERHASDVRIDRVYGVAETASVYIYNPPELENNHILGIPLQGIRIKIFDDDANELPIGQQGRICVSTPASAMPLETEEEDSSLKRQLRDERTWVFTGTLGHLDDNHYVYFDGSITRKFDINGQYFYPYRLENEILEIDGVLDCLVFVDTEENDIIAAIVPEEEYLFDNDKLLELKEQIEIQTKQLHHSTMRQNTIEFLASLPKTRRGENDYREFEIQHAERKATPIEDILDEDL